MAGHRNFERLRKKMPPCRRLANEQAAQKQIRRMLLAELRRVAGITQVTMADTMGVSQSALSRMESQDDMHVSTLRRLVEALGGDLEIIARLPSGPVAVTLARGAVAAAG